MDIVTPSTTESSENQTAQFDSTQYTRESIKKYENIFGHNFISTGGLESTRDITRTLGLEAGMKVLDVGSGIGGSAFHMSREYGVHVHGLDLSHNMLAIAQERLAELKLQSLVTFEYCDVLQASIEAEYDLIYSRDAFLHIQDKPRLFQTLKRALKPGGLLFFTDYCWGEGQHSPEFLDYVAQRQYTLHTVREYGQLIEAAGFIDVEASDKTRLFGHYLHLELERLPNDGSLQDIRKSWNEKIVRNQRGEQGWGWFRARKPA